jgi:hypothetical protein
MGRFIISVITNVCNKKTSGIVHSHRKTEKVFFFGGVQLDLFYVCTAGDTAHIDTIFKFLPHVRQHGCIDILHCCYVAWHRSLQQWRILMNPCWHMCGKNFNIISMCAVSPVVHTSNISNCQKKIFSFPVAVNNSIMVGPLVFLL